MTPTRMGTLRSGGAFRSRSGTTTAPAWLTEALPVESSATDGMRRCCYPRGVCGAARRCPRRFRERVTLKVIETAVGGAGAVRRAD